MVRVLRYFGAWEPAYRRADVEQLFCVEESTDAWKLGRSTFAVCARVKSLANPVSLMTGLSTAEDALYVERTIENFMNIEDLPVDGEIAEKDLAERRRKSLGP